MNAWTLTGLGLNLAVLLMALAWVWARRVNNAGWVDVARSLAFAPVVWLYAALGSGDPVRRGVVAGMVTIWSLRLGLHILGRMRRHAGTEAPRYAALREQFPQRPWLMFFGFFQVQAVLVGILSVPFAIACANPAPGLTGFEFAGLALWFCAVLGGAVSDFQLQDFRAQPANAGRVCDVGLRRYSRHPNDFFEWCVWAAYFLFALGSLGEWIASHLLFRK